MHKRTYLNACLVLALAAGANQASAAPGASEMGLFAFKGVADF